MVRSIIWQQWNRQKIDAMKPEARQSSPATWCSLKPTAVVQGLVLSICWHSLIVILCQGNLIDTQKRQGVTVHFPRLLRGLSCSWTTATNANLDKRRSCWYLQLAGFGIYLGSLNERAFMEFITYMRTIWRPKEHQTFQSLGRGEAAGLRPLMIPHKYVAEASRLDKHGIEVAGGTQPQT